MIARWICFICILMFSLRMMFFLYAGISIDISDNQRKSVKKKNRVKKKKRSTNKKVDIDEEIRVRRKIAK
ncbi:MAG: hypothetical protein N4A54_12885 [Peptostreptococcaceae bacterium]|nr:hypothetical protein [Peptostreptococcaceae bacterium]